MKFIITQGMQRDVFPEDEMLDFHYEELAEDQ